MCLKTKYNILLVLTTLAIVFTVLSLSFVDSNVDSDSKESQAEISDLHLNEGTKIETTTPENSETLAYYTVFKLILNFLPLKEIN